MHYVKRSLWLALLVGCLTTQSAFSQAKLIEKVSRKGTELLIPYEKYVLPNGLTVVVHEDHSDPLVHVDVTYHVGSAREEIGKSGFAHFFEHMMFQGSDHVANGEHFKLVTQAGGTLNGTTNRDRTNYFETVPSNQLERAIWLEADRMGFLLDAVTQQKFEIQRATVKNERGQNYDNRPYGLAEEVTAKTLYPYGHPYSWLTIGYVEDLNRVNVDDLKNFFKRWYGPNNAVLTVGGDVTPAEVVRLALQYFGPVKRGPAVKKTVVPAPVLTADRYVSYEDNVRFPMLRLTYPSVPRHHPDEVALDALAAVLGGGKTSRLYQRMVKTQKAVQVNVIHPTSELAGEFSFIALPLPTFRLDSTEALLRASMLELERQGVSDDELAQFKASREVDLIGSLSSVAGKVSRLAEFQTFDGNPNQLPGELSALRKLTKADVMRVYNQYIKEKKAVVTTVYPKGQKAIVTHADNYTASPAGYQAPDYAYTGLTYTKPADTFDRSKLPAVGPNPTVKVPPFYKETFPNGLRMIGVRSDEVPTVTLYLSLKGGHLLAQQNLSKAGVAQLTASLLNEATRTHSTEELTRQLEKLGSSITFFAGPEEMGVSVESLTKNLDATLAILREKLGEPRFDPADFERLKKQQLELIANQSTQPVVIANKAYNRLLFGSDNIRAIPVSGTRQSVETLTLDDVKEFYNTQFTPSVAKLVVVGEVDKDALLTKLAFLKNWAAKPVSLPTLPALKATEKTRIYLVDKPGAAQSEIRIGYLTDLPYDATGEYYRSTLTNFILGGAFNSRLNLNLRENKGYTYGAMSRFSSTFLPGPFTAQAGVRAAVTDSAVVEFVKEINQYAQQGITAEELNFTKNSVGQRDALRYETPFQKAQFLGQILEYNLPADFVEQQTKILSTLTREQVGEMAIKRFPIDKMIILVVGDKAKIKPGLDKLGYELVELDKEGNAGASITNK
ncbi:M16 family metallopeptidase [Spirosoma oryzicola]|uniref:M16 family metallopeptidase n=1 Tax=Spirosoma oryzicola TaxID=2898794 RepID=UPI001E30999F|nr:pitrilysin family protein [Spirosoma oryzicola]UHG93883.1 insulinase family protein [Spirosoma oryzicola]